MNASTEIADGEYEQAKRAAFERGCPTQINVKMIERRCGLRAGQLANYRANHYSRKKKLAVKRTKHYTALHDE